MRMNLEIKASLVETAERMINNGEDIWGKMSCLEPDWGYMCEYKHGSELSEGPDDPVQQATFLLFVAETIET